MSETTPEDMAEDLSYIFTEDQANAIAGDVYQVLLDKIIQMDKEVKYWQNEVIQLNECVGRLLEDKKPAGQ